MGAAREQQAFNIQSQLMTEIIVDIIPVSILHIEMLIALRHWMNLRNTGNSMDALSYVASLVYYNELFTVYFRPFCSNAMQVPPLGIELLTDSIGRYNDLCLPVLLQEISQASCMVVMSVGDENIVNGAESYAQHFRISHKHITCSGVKQDAVFLRFQQYR